MGYISDLRKFVGHQPILTAGVGLLVFNSENKVLIMGGISRLCKESDATFILNMENFNQVKYNNLPKAGTIEHEVYFDEIGDMHLFYENKYGTSPPTHIIYSFLDYNSV